MLLSASGTDFVTMIAKKTSQETDMKYFSIVTLLILCFIGPALAGEADVIAVDVKRTGAQTYSFDVTVRHADHGWDHYADGWEVIAPDGKALGKRILAHPHTNEQPFTRSLSGVKIPADVSQVSIRAHDSVHDYGGETLVIDVD
jgi:hypothetical protein